MKTLPLLTAALLTFSAAATTPTISQPPKDFKGWQGMRVIPMEDYYPDFITADLSGEGRASIIALNPAKRRLDVIRWLKPEARKAAKPNDPEQPNALPAAADFERISIALETPPLGVVATSFDAKNPKQLSLYILTSLPNRVQQLSQTKDGKWEVVNTWELLSGEWGGHEQSLIRYQDKLLVSMKTGIQVIEPKTGSRPTWLRAAKDSSRVAWQVADLDHDGIPDLLEYTRQNDQTLRFFKGVKGDAGQAGLLAPRVIRERPVEGLALLDGEGVLFTLESAGEGPVQRLQLLAGETSPVGRLMPLTLSETSRNMSASFLIEGKPTLAVVDSAQPQISLYELGENGWQSARDFPILPNVEAMIAPENGTLLFKVKDTEGLFVSKWDGKRMSYPATFEGNGEGKVVGLGMTGATSWWVLRNKNQLTLKTMSAGKNAESTVYTGKFEKTDKVVWAGDKRLLALELYAAAPRLVLPAEGEEKTAKEISAPYITSALMDELMLIPDGTPAPVRLTAGVVQLLGNDLKPFDQIMLPDGLAITSFTANGFEFYALAGGRIFRFGDQTKGGNADPMEMLKPSASWRAPAGAKSLRASSALGLLASTHTGIAQLSKGADVILKSDGALASDVGQPADQNDPAIHRLLSADLTGNGKEQLLLCNDDRHQLTAIGADLMPWFSWPVFTDQKYPYSGHNSKENLLREPRQATGADLDGDHVQDLILACQDRLVIYLGKDPK